MPSMIESLIGAGVARPDDKRVLPTRRPLPGRPRDLFELVSVLGEQATLQAIVESCDLRQAEPRLMTYVALGRWPTAAELDALPRPYVPRVHLRALLFGRAFRDSLVRRLCDAYPERPRLLYIRIPRCAGSHFLNMAQAMHAIIPNDLARWLPGDGARFVPALGRYLGSFALTRTIMAVQSSLAPFTEVAPQPSQATGQALPWSPAVPLRRPSDRLFAIVRDPGALMMSQVNAIIAALRGPPAADTADIAALRTRLGPLPIHEDAAGWKSVGLAVLHAHPLKNPICQALGDGTAATALGACRLSDIELAELSLYTDWVKYTWDVEPEPPANVGAPFLTEDDLGEAGTRQLGELIAEDRVFYARFQTALAQRDAFKAVVRGRDL